MAFSQIADETSKMPAITDPHFADRKMHGECRAVQRDGGLRHWGPRVSRSRRFTHKPFLPMAIAGQEFLVAAHAFRWKGAASRACGCMAPFRKAAPGSPLRETGSVRRTIRAPISASRSAAISPIPEVPPVMHRKSHLISIFFGAKFLQNVCKVGL